MNLLKMIAELSAAAAQDGDQEVSVAVIRKTGRIENGWRTVGVSRWSPESDNGDRVVLLVTKEQAK